MVPVLDGCGAAKDEHGAAVEMRVGDAGDAVGDARSGGQQGDAGIARDLGPALGGMHCRLLVAGIYDPNTLAHAAVIDGGDVAAAEGENDFHALALECAGNQPAAENMFLHRVILPSGRLEAPQLVSV